ncbi:MAG: fatty acyl-AMP ligase [Planctomycetes bacterium]|nr:fatty acyl-AMP ligase [Planctomycetota bacterium]
MTAVGMLDSRAAESPNRRAYLYLLDGEHLERSVTYSELDQRARSIGGRLQSMGLRGERVLLACGHGIDFLSALFGCFYAGVIAVPVEAPLRPRRASRLRRIAIDSGARILLASGAEMTRSRAAVLANLTDVDLDWIDVETANRSSDDDCDFVPVHAGDIAYLQYTSGSTGTPRGVAISHENLLSNLAHIDFGVEQTAESVSVQWLPLHHDMGLVNALYATYVGFPCVMFAPGQFVQRPLRWLEAISRYRATYSGGPNFAYKFCSQQGEISNISGLDLSRWQVAFCGAEFVRAETLAQFHKCFASVGFREEALYPCYGLAEFTVAVTGGRTDRPPVVRHIATDALRRGIARYCDTHDPRSTISIVGCGNALPEHSVSIVDPGTRKPLDDMRVGEIWAAGASRGQGYFGRREETEAVFHARLDSGKGPFLRTGDLGFLDKGELFVTGRANDLIVICGRKYYPDDIEWIVETAHPNLLAGGCAAFSAEEHIDEKLIVVAELVRTALRNGDHAQVVSAIRHALLNRRELDVAHVVLVRPGGVPRSPNGKIQRGACRHNYLAQTLPRVTSAPPQRQ